MNYTPNKTGGKRGLVLAATVLLTLVGQAMAQALDDVQVSQTASSYVAGSNTIIECTFAYPADRLLKSLLWTPTLPAGWTLVATPGATTGNGLPEIDPDGQAVIFLEQNLSALSLIHI